MGTNKEQFVFLNQLSVPYLCAVLIQNQNQTLNQVDGKCRGITNNDGSTFRPYKRLVPDEYCRSEDNGRSDKPRCRLG